MKHRFAESSQLSRNFHAMHPSLEGLMMCFQDQGLQCGIILAQFPLYQGHNLTLVLIRSHLGHPNSCTAFRQIGLIMQLGLETSLPGPIP